MRYRSRLETNIKMDPARIIVSRCGMFCTSSNDIWCLTLYLELLIQLRGLMRVRGAQDVAHVDKGGTHVGFRGISCLLGKLLGSCSVGAGVKIEWSYTSIPSVCLRGEDKSLPFCCLLLKDIVLIPLSSSWCRWYTLPVDRFWSHLWSSSVLPSMWFGIF